VLLACLVLGTAPADARAQPKTSQSVVKASATATRPDAEGRQTVTVALAIDRPWHLYANPVGNDQLADSATTVTVEGKVKPEEVRVTYPPGKLVRDSLGAYRVYEDKVTIKAQVRRAPGDTGPLDVKVEIQACGAKSCLVPSTLTLRVAE
jgi:DsbC/DsbD-like thiol-disulfide interchange protein